MWIIIIQTVKYEIDRSETGTIWWAFKLVKILQGYITSVSIESTTEANSEILSSLPEDVFLTRQPPLS